MTTPTTVSQFVADAAHGPAVLSLPGAGLVAQIVNGDAYILREQVGSEVIVSLDHEPVGLGTPRFGTITPAEVLAGYAVTLAVRGRKAIEAMEAAA